MYSLQFLVSVVVVAILHVPTLHAQVAETKIKDRTTFLPHQKYEPIPGKAVGILIGDPTTVLAHEGRGGPPKHICFARGTSSYRWIYIVTQGIPQITDLQMPAGLKGEIPQRYPSLVMADPESIRPFGKIAKFTLIEAEVNQGQGSPVYESFVITNLKVVEGTQEFPGRVADMVALAQKEHAHWERTQMADVNKALAELSKKVMNGRGNPSGPRETSQLMYVTWLPESERVLVRFRTKITDGNYHMGAAGGANPQNFPDKAPPPRPQFKMGTSFGLEVGRGYEFSKAGALVATELLPTDTFVSELPLPPVGRGRPQ